MRETQEHLSNWGPSDLAPCSVYTVIGSLAGEEKVQEKNDQREGKADPRKGRWALPQISLDLIHFGFQKPWDVPPVVCE